jgi:hypothetical protein
MNTLTLDASALIAFERADRRCVVLLLEATKAGGTLVVPAGVLAQVWRDGARQVRLARLFCIPEVKVVALDDELARAAGQRCGVSGTSDVVNASVALVGRRHGGVVVTSDPDDLHRLDPMLDLIVV